MANGSNKVSTRRAATSVGGLRSIRTAQHAVEREGEEGGSGLRRSCSSSRSKLVVAVAGRVTSKFLTSRTLDDSMFERARLPHLRSHHDANGHLGCSACGFGRHRWFCSERLRSPVGDSPPIIGLLSRLSRVRPAIVTHAASRLKDEAAAAAFEGSRILWHIQENAIPARV
eukprot:scaffold106870_cov32-Tisochrysis_lutea.AAC.2